jgi:hypothetical protein
MKFDVRISTMYNLTIDLDFSRSVRHRHRTQGRHHIEAAHNLSPSISPLYACSAALRLSRPAAALLSLERE